MSREDRRFSRVPESFQVDCRRLGVFSEGWRKVATTDISAGGISFETEELFDLDESVEIQLTLPNFRTPFLIRGKVMRSHPRPKGTWEVALQFVEIKPEEQLQIDELVRFLRRTLPEAEQ